MSTPDDSTTTSVKSSPPLPTWMKLAVEVEGKLCYQKINSCQTPPFYLSQAVEKSNGINSNSFRGSVGFEVLQAVSS